MPLRYFTIFVAFFVKRKMKNESLGIKCEEGVGGGRWPNLRMCWIKSPHRIPVDRGWFSLAWMLFFCFPFKKLSFTCPTIFPTHFTMEIGSVPFHRIVNKICIFHHRQFSNCIERYSSYTRGGRTFLFMGHFHIKGHIWVAIWPFLI